MNYILKLVMVHGAMEHVVVKLSVCRNDVELLAGVCLFVLCSHVIMSPVLLNFYCPDGTQSLAPLFVCKSIPIILMFEGPAEPGQIKLSSSFLTQAIETHAGWKYISLHYIENQNMQIKM